MMAKSKWKRFSIAAYALLLMLCACVGRADAASRTSTYQVLDDSFTWITGWNIGSTCGANRGGTSGTADAVATLAASTEGFTSATYGFTHTCWHSNCRLFFNGVDLGYSLNTGCCSGSGAPSLDISDLYEPGQANQIQIKRIADSSNCIMPGSSGQTVRVTITVNRNIITSPSNAFGFSSTTTPTITWVSFGGATSYKLQVDDTGLFNPPLFEKTGLTATSYTLSGAGAELLTNGITYYARVQAENGSDTGVNKPVDFTVDTTAPPAPTLTYPAANATITTTKPKFDWSPVTSGAE
jgi:hypothetical protein